MYTTLKRCAELADNLNISTARFYKDKYLQYFTTSGEGKKTRYDETSTVELLLLITNSYKQNFDMDQIVELLDSKYGVIVTDLVPQTEDNTTVTARQSMVEAIRTVVSEEVKQLSDQVETLINDANTRDVQSQSRDEMLLTTMRMMIEKRKPWWKKWGK